MIEAGFGGIAHLCERGKGMRKKQAAILLTVAAAFLLAGCAVGPSADRNGEVLLGQGTALIARMQALSDEEAYLEWMLSSTQEMQEAVDQITAGDYQTPLAVFSIGVPQQAVDMMLEGQEEISETVRQELGRRFFASAPMQLTAKGGAYRLAVSSALTVQESFVFKGLKQARMYLYLYGGDWSAAVFYQPGQDGAVTASASFLYDPQLREVSTLEELERWKGQIDWLAGGAVEQIA